MVRGLTWKPYLRAPSIGSVATDKYRQLDKGQEHIDGNSNSIPTTPRNLRGIEQTVAMSLWALERGSRPQERVSLWYFTATLDPYLFWVHWVPY